MVHTTLTVPARAAPTGGGCHALSHGSPRMPPVTTPVLLFCLGVALVGATGYLVGLRSGERADPDSDRTSRFHAVS